MSPWRERAMSSVFIHYDDSFPASVKRRGNRLILVIAVGCLSVCGCQSFQKRVSMRSAHCGALCARAREAREQGNAEQANQFINEALRHKPADTESRRQLAEVMWNNGRKAEAIAEFSQLCAQQPKDKRLASRLACMQWDAGQQAAAASTAQILLKLDPQSKEAWLIKARSEAAKGFLDESLASYLRLSQIAPDDLPTMIDLGKLHLQRGNSDRACPLFRSAVEHPQATAEQRAEIEWLLGVAYTQTDRWTDAVPMLERAIVQRSATVNDWCLLCSARMQCGDHKGAEADLQRALQRDPASTEARELSRRLALLQEFQPPNGFVTPASHMED